MDGDTHSNQSLNGSGNGFGVVEPETRDMILHWFREDELSECPNCGNRHVLPGWGSPNGRMCVTCGPLTLSAAPEPHPTRGVAHLD